MQISSFIKRNFQTIQPYAGIHAAKEALIRNGAIVVVDEETNAPLGVLTLLDIIQRPHLLVIDCLSKKPTLSLECDVETALQIMHDQQTEVLPVYREKEFEGLVFKNDIIEFLSAQEIELEKKVIEKTAQLQQVNKSLEESKNILKAIYDSTKSIRFLVAPDYTILFFNKKAYENSIALHDRELKVGDSLLEYAKDFFNQIDSDFKNNFEKALQGEHIVTESEMKYLDTLLWLRTEYYPVHEENRLIGVSIAIADINKRKKNELHIQNQNQILKEIIHTESHELRRPVANILGIMELFDRSELSEENKEVLKLLETTTKQLDDIIKIVVQKAFEIAKI